MPYRARPSAQGQCQPREPVPKSSSRQMTCLATPPSHARPPYVAASGRSLLVPSKMLLNQRMSFIIRISTCYECFSESQFAKFARWALLLDEPTFLHSVQADKDKVSGQFMKGPAGTSEPTSKTRSCSSHTAQRLRSCGGTKWRKKVKRLRPRSGQRRVPLFFQTVVHCYSPFPSYILE